MDDVFPQHSQMSECRKISGLLGPHSDALRAPQGRGTEGQDCMKHTDGRWVAGLNDLGYLFQPW